MLSLVSESFCVLLIKTMCRLLSEDSGFLPHDAVSAQETSTLNKWLHISAAHFSMSYHSSMVTTELKRH